MDSLCSPGLPVPEVSWFRDGQAISTSTLPGVQISFSDGRARLTIPAVTKANSGRYSLRATNGSGQATSTAELLVTGRLEAQPVLCAPCPPRHLQDLGKGIPKELLSTGKCSSKSREGPPEAELIAKLFALWNLIFLSKHSTKVAENQFLYTHIKHSKIY